MQISAPAFVSQPPVAVPSSLLSPVEHAFANASWLQDLRIGQEPVRELLDRQLRIGFRRIAGERIELVPHTQAALTLLRGPNAARTEAVLQALDGAVRVGRERSQSKGISISETYEGFMLNTLIDGLQMEGGISPIDRSFAAALRDPAERPRFQALVDAWFETNEANATFGTWVNVYRRTGATLRALFEGTPASQLDPKLATITAQALGHELQHSITPAKSAEYEDANGQRGRLAWMEEGGSELTSLTTGSDRAIARALGMPFDEQLREVQYADWTDAVYRIARLAGFDAATPAGAQRAAETLQYGSLTRAPGRFARAIADAHGLTTSQTEHLRLLIRDSAGEAAKIDAIEEWVSMVGGAAAR